jgi:hypothetical protein
MPSNLYTIYYPRAHKFINNVKLTNVPVKDLYLNNDENNITVY